MKRKVEATEPAPAKRRNTSLEIPTNLQTAFRNDLFNESTVTKFREAYKTSAPYPHAVVPSLIQKELLSSVRNEITTHISFTLKETDIYRIHQSGDLANLSKLDAESLEHLPSLVKLRDALYSPRFREWVSEVTGAGKVSGTRTDMAVNVYTPGSYLLCHDDVIGSRRVSYILYLTDPDKPWKAKWGGGLRLYPTETKKNKQGELIQVPLAEHSLNIPPSFGQLSFFAVRPGESYHDVEEVYHAAGSKADGGRIRMAISGWYHIPQEGEDGYEAGVEESQAQKSSLAQLKGAAHEFDEPRMVFKHFDEPRTVMDSHADRRELDPGDTADQDEDILTEQDLTFLLHYISPSFLTPDMIEQFSQSFEDTSVLQLEHFFGEKFASELREYISAAESEHRPGHDTRDHPSHWKIARPPHKHRYAYLQSSESLHKAKSPISHLLADLLHSHAFKKWLALVTGLKAPSLIRQNAIARRFRRGKDYALANPFQGEQPQLEFTINMTPSSGWDTAPEEQSQQPLVANGSSSKTNGHHHIEHEAGEVQVDTNAATEYGGEEVYMAGDVDDDTSIHSKSLPHVGKKADPAVYKSSAVGGDDEDDGILFTSSPAWNTFSVVLRDKGTLRFVKYVSQAANGDRWDVKGEVELAEDAFDGEDEEEDDDESGIDDPSDLNNLSTVDEEEEDSNDDDDNDEDEDDDDDEQQRG